MLTTCDLYRIMIKSRLYCYFFKNHGLIMAKILSVFVFHFYVVVCLILFSCCICFHFVILLLFNCLSPFYLFLLLFCSLVLVCYCGDVLLGWCFCVDVVVWPFIVVLLCVLCWCSIMFLFVLLCSCCCCSPCVDVLCYNNES